MATNDFIGFASNGSANVMSQADYAAASEQLVGVQPGMASSALANKAWRQGANMAAAIGALINSGGYDALDNGDLATLKTNLYNALVALFLPLSGSTMTSDYVYYKSGVQICAVATRENSITAGTYLDVAITWPRAFANVSYIPMVSMQTGSSAIDYGSITAAILDYSTTTTGITARVFNNSGNTRAPCLNFIAIGEGAM